MINNTSAINFNRVNNQTAFLPVTQGYTYGSPKQDEFKNTNTKECIKKLFPNGVENIRITQGDFDNCQLLASIDAIAHNKKGAKIIKNTIFSEESGNAKLAFKKYPEKTIPVDKSENQGYTFLGKIIEKILQNKKVNDPAVRTLTIGYAKLMKEVYPEKFKNVQTSKICSIYNNDTGYHYLASEVLRDFTGLEVKTYGIDEKLPKEGYVSFTEQGSKATKEVTDFLDEYSKNTDKYVVAACSKYLKNSTKIDDKKEIMGWHDMSVRSVDAQNKTITLSDPHDNSKPLSLTYDEFLKYFSLISVVDMG